jgi:hypothetical protein
MMSKIWNTKLLHIILGVTFLVGLLPISNHMPSMQGMHMAAEVSISSTAQEKTGHNSTGSCCEAIGSLLFACDFIVFQTACLSSNGGSEQIAYLVPIVQSFYT